MQFLTDQTNFELIFKLGLSESLVMDSFDNQLERILNLKLYFSYSSSDFKGLIDFSIADIPAGVYLITMIAVNSNCVKGLVISPSF